ncbi:protein yellow-like [Anastrepha ludens]|uniref:protein yellow-like n=1 Tax=Anastrepha ludens TaxID=28586 RepID=UPI0023B154E4|nr:protein yellow-like [Anastrepha ludens]
MSLSNEVDRALLAIDRRSNHLSSEQMRHHEEVLSIFIAAEDEEDDPFVTDDDNDEDYVPVDDEEVSDIENELGVEEELPENEEMYEVEWDEVIEPEHSVSNLTSGVNRLLGEKEQCYECKIDNMFWKKEPPAPRARHWNRFTSISTRPVGPAHRFLPNPVSIFPDIMSPHRRNGNVIISIEQRDIETVFEWKKLDYGFPTEEDRQEALNNGKFVPNNGFPIGMAPHRQSQNDTRVFVTIPRFQTGIPYTLATVNDTEDGPVLYPYPSYEWHTAQGSNCDNITSVFRVALTECNQMVVLDTGMVGFTQNCPPQLLVFDLNTDTLVRRYHHWLWCMILLQAAPARTFKCTLYADVSYHGLVIYDSEQNTAWRAENKFMYPNPDYGTHTIAGENFTLMDGIFGLATDQRQLYFHPLASNSEYAVPLNVLNNRTNWANNSGAMEDEFRSLGQRSSECAAETMDSQNNLYCVTFNPIQLTMWNTNTTFNATNVLEVPADPSLIEFVSDMKVFKNDAGIEELWMISIRFQKFFLGTLNSSEVNYRILRRPLDDIQNLN